MTHNGWPKGMFFDSTDLSTLWTGSINLMIKSQAATLDTRGLIIIGNKMKDSKLVI